MDERDYIAMNKPPETKVGSVTIKREPAQSVYLITIGDLVKMNEYGERVDTKVDLWLTHAQFEDLKEAINKVMHSDKKQSQ
jgi:hypothetical protein